jgi:hypothetical protein
MTNSDGLELDRRALLHGAAVLSTLAAMPIAARAAVPRQAIRFVIADQRFRESKALGEKLSREGAQRLEVTSGLTAIWKDYLYPHWQRSEGGAVVGLTTRSVWDGLSQQAYGQFRKGRMIGLHQSGTTSEQCQHSIEAPVRAMPNVELGAEHWPLEVAQLLTHVAQESSCFSQSRLIGQPIPAHKLRHQLISWIIR